jgi:DNA invertase Pin-like site-specific DNA recombinase
MKYGYARVSSKSASLDEQIQILTSEGCEKIYSEHFTGTKKERPEFQKLLPVLNDGDTLVVTKLDRFARSVSDGATIIKELLKRGVTVNILNMGIIDEKPTSRLALNILLAFAEFERDMIVDRTQSGKAIAKQREDYREGRPKKFNKKQIELAMELINTHTYKEVEEKTGISKSTLIRAKRERNQIAF